MANPALQRPAMPGPQPVQETKVTAAPGSPAAPLLRTSSGETPDRIFKAAMTACGLGVLGVLFLIVYELISGSGLSWHAFGFKFFAVSDWDPVNEHFGALPFIYGTLVSSLLALIIAVPLAVGVAVFTTEMCPKAFRGPLAHARRAKIGLLLGPASPHEGDNFGVRLPRRRGIDEPPGRGWLARQGKAVRLQVADPGPPQPRTEFELSALGDRNRE